MRAPDRRRRRPSTGEILLVLSVLISSGALSASAGASAAPAEPRAHGSMSSSVPTLRDGDSLNATFGSRSSEILDSETTPPSPAQVRSYTIDLRTNRANASQPILLESDPLNFWSDPNQMPNGADNLPPLSNWTWWIETGQGVNDTSNWTVDPTDTYLERPTTWTDQNYTVFGVSDPTLYVNVTPSETDGAHATGGGFVLNAVGYPDSVPTGLAYEEMAASLHPSLVRFTLLQAGAFTGWDSATHQPTLSFTGLDRLFDLAEETGGAVVLSLPAGNWGDGNSVPSGTPLMSSPEFDFHGLLGYLMTPAAMYALVRQIENHTIANSESVLYWSIGNEVPINSTAEAAAFSRVVNAAARAVHAGLPNDLVGSDDMMSPTYLGTFARDTTGVGFLSFHWYQSWGICVNATGSYCPPAGAPNGTPTPKLFAHPAYRATTGTYPPGTAQWDWYNATGNWLPVINTETNLAAYGGPGSATSATGTDPRIPDLVGAAWLGSTLVDSSNQNLSALTYFALSSSANLTGTPTYAHGGFGFGMTNTTSTGAITYFAPYYVMKLWDQYLPQGSSGLSLTDTGNGTVRAFAVIDSGGVNVALVSRVGVPVSVRLSVLGHFGLKQLDLLDSSSYAESYNASSGSTTLVRSGVSINYDPQSDTVNFPGYGFAVAQFVPSGLAGNGSSGGNGTGNTSTGGLGLTSGSGVHANPNGTIGVGLGGTGSGGAGDSGTGTGGGSSASPGGPTGTPGPNRTGATPSPPPTGGVPAILTRAVHSREVTVLAVGALVGFVAAVAAAVAAGRAPRRRAR